jgi:hypothetical protein
MPFLPIILFTMIGIVFVFETIMSGAPLPWGICAGGCLFIVGYLVVRSFIPVKRFRDDPVSVPVAPTAKETIDGNT